MNEITNPSELKVDGWLRSLARDVEYHRPTQVPHLRLQRANMFSKRGNCMVEGLAISARRPQGRKEALCVQEYEALVARIREDIDAIEEGQPSALGDALERAGVRRVDFNAQSYEHGMLRNASAKAMVDACYA